ncbi:MAG: hydroxyethylthiazole kinase [Bacteroidota bacterium]
MENIKTIAQLLRDVKTKKPLVHHLTNYVTVNDCANIVLALGGSPVMADDAGEVEEMVGIASALVINIGTLNARTIEAMLLAGKKANQLGIPVVLDPVGAGATALRTTTAAKLIQEVKLAVLRGNMSEIKVVAGAAARTRGVDSADDGAGAAELALNLAKRLGCTVAITGVQDIVSDGSRSGLIDNGHPSLARITGTGCMATSLIGCYAGVTADSYLAACAGLITMGLAGEKAAASLNGSEGIGSFKVKLMDGIDRLTPDELLRESKLTER